LLGRVGKGQYSSQTGKTVHRNRIRTYQILHIHKIRILDMGAGVCLRRIAYIPALHIPYHLQPQIIRLLNQGIVIFHPFPVIFLKKCRINLHRRHQGSHNSQYFGAELKNRVAGSLHVHFVIEIFAVDYFFRKLGIHRINPYHRRGAFFLYCLG